MQAAKAGAVAVVLIAGTAGLAPTPGTSTAATSGKKTGLALKRVARGFDAPTHLAAPRSEKRRLYVVEQSGRVWLIDRGRRRARPFLDIRDRVGTGTEQGLFSVAFHPRYGQNRKLYVNYTDKRGNTRVVEFRAKGRKAFKTTARQILWVPQPRANHNGGHIAFGPDGYLYVGMGDGGGPGDPQNLAQDETSRLGNLMKINVDREDAQWITVGYGLRNPWRFAFDSEKGDLYLADVGQESVEEVNFTPRISPGLENYGWDVYEGHARFENKAANQAGRLVMPLASYTHSLGCSVTGGVVYRGKQMPPVRGRYFYGDFCSGRVWSLRVRDREATSHRLEPFTVRQLVSFSEDGRGELYLVSRRGTVYKLVKR